MPRTETFLKRLELQGFKSFAPKTTFEFPARVTAIVGPNGSGKSNIIDAFRWVLGEREAKQLRGDTLDTLIFAGTPKRGAASLARVALYFDNSARVFDDGGEEVMLVRKVDRSGSSQFFFHDADVKLKDLLPMLARARLGARGLTMIGQGQSDVFVKSSADERRAMIEEVLGLREFRIKKAQAERRLLSSEIHMDKIKAMMEEIAPHLRFLRKQKSKWDRRSEIASELRETENRYFGARYHELAVHLHVKTGRTPHGEELEHRRETLRKDIHALEQSLAALEKTASQTVTVAPWRERMRALLDERMRKEKELARLEARAEVDARAVDGADRSDAYVNILREILEGIRRARITPDPVALQEALDVWEQKIAAALAIPTVDQSRNEVAAQIAACARHITTIDESITLLQKEEEQSLKTHEARNKEFRDHIHALEAKKNEVRTIDATLQEQRFEFEKTALRLDELAREWESIGRERGELEKLPKPDESLEYTRAERHMVRLRGDLAAIGEIDAGLVQEAQETEERFMFLKRESEDLAGATVDLRKLVRDLDARIHEDFKKAFRSINEEFNNHFRIMFGGGKAYLRLVKNELPKEKTDEEEAQQGKEVPVSELVSPQSDAVQELSAGVEVEVSLPRKRITSLDMLSGGEKSLVSIAALFALVAVSPPPFLVLDEFDAALDEENARRFAGLVKEFSKRTQFIIVTHNRATMEVADVLYGITMGDDGVSTVLSLKVEQ